MAPAKKPQKQKADKAQKVDKALKTKQTPTTTEMFPSLHKEIENALSSEGTTIKPKPWFNRAETDKARIQQHETYIMGKFRCYNPVCQQNGWGSKKIFTLIQRFPNSGYNAIVFKQSCRACKKVGKMSIDEQAYIERVTFRLKRWAGITMVEEDHERKPGPPHDEDHCEACKRGFCQRGRRFQR
jgi:hypothetical protein